MNLWKFIYRMCLLASILMGMAIIVFHVFLPKIREHRELRAAEDALRQDIQRTAEEAADPATVAVQALPRLSDKARWP